MSLEPNVDHGNGTLVEQRLLETNYSTLNFKPDSSLDLIVVVNHRALRALTYVAHWAHASLGVWEWL